MENGGRRSREFEPNRLRGVVLTPVQAYNAMILFVDLHARLRGSDELTGLTFELAFRAGDGLPFDRAMWTDWLDSIERALELGTDNPAEPG